MLDDQHADSVVDLVAKAIHADTWIEEKPDQPNPDWHRRFQWWQAVHAARLAVAALRAEGLLIDGGGSAYDDVMSNREARQAIPPAYTHWLGDRLLARTEAAA